METQAEVWAIFEAEARKIQRSNETIQQAIDRVYTKRPDLVQRYQAASPAQPKAQTEPDPWAGRRRSKAAYEAIERKAEELRQKDPALTKAQAFDRVWSTNLDLRSKYLAAAEADKARPEDEPVEDSDKKKDEDQSALIDTVVQKTMAVSLEAFKALHGSEKAKPPAKREENTGLVLIEYANGLRRWVSPAVAQRSANKVRVIDDDEAA